MGLREPSWRATPGCLQSLYSHRSLRLRVGGGLGARRLSSLTIPIARPGFSRRRRRHRGPGEPPDGDGRRDRRQQHGGRLGRRREPGGAGKPAAAQARGDSGKRSRADRDPAFRGGESQPVLPARLQPRSRHRSGHRDRRHAGQHADSRPRPGLHGPQLPHPRAASSDLHYKKGPYYADEGDFATAGAVRMDLVNESADSATLGRWPGRLPPRPASGLDRTSAPARCWAPAEVYHNDGPFDGPDDYRRLNGVLRYTRVRAIGLLHPHGNGVLGPLELPRTRCPSVRSTSGLIDRFGSSQSDATAATTSRASLSFNRVRRTDSDQTQFSAYVIRYQLDLWSTFTYYLQGSRQRRSDAPAR